MYAQTTVLPKDVKFLRLDLNEDGGEPSVIPQTLQVGDQISFEDMSLMFNGASE
jgi:hypothetical protein